MPAFIGHRSTLGVLALALLRLPVPVVAAREKAVPAATTIYSPAWAPDGSRISFDAKADGRWSIFVIDADGSNLRPLTSGPGSHSSSSWSPDGTQIAFASTRDGNPEVYVMRSDGSEPRRLTAHPGEDTYPRFSPDGRLIAFRSERSGRRELYVMRPDGSDWRALTSGTLDVDGRFAWAPDGRRLVFHALPRGQRPDLSVAALLYAAGVDGSGATALTAEARREYNPSFSPDGSWLAVDAHERGLWDSDDLGWEIFAVRPDGSERRQLTRNRVNDWGPAWSPDGSRIAYCSGSNDVYEIHVMRADGSQPKRITRLVPGFRGEEGR